MGATKTTFYLDDELRAELKTLAAKRGTSVTELLREGARLVLDRHAGTLDREELAVRAARARERLREGLYRGAAVSEAVDETLYGRRGR